MKIALGLVSFLLSLNAFAMGRNNDYSSSIYGDRAQKIFDASPKLTEDCSYAANGGSFDAKLRDLLKDDQIHSVSCVHVGETTYACEASTLWFSKACGKDLQN